MEECCVSVARETSGHTVHTPNKGNNERDTSAGWDVHYIDMTNTGLPVPCILLGTCAGAVVFSTQYVLLM